MQLVSAPRKYLSTRLLERRGCEDAGSVINFTFAAWLAVCAPSSPVCQFPENELMSVILVRGEIFARNGGVDISHGTANYGEPLITLLITVRRSNICITRRRAHASSVIQGRVLFSLSYQLLQFYDKHSFVLAYGHLFVERTTAATIILSANSRYYARVCKRTYMVFYKEREIS